MRRRTLIATLAVLAAALAAAVVVATAPSEASTLRFELEPTLQRQLAGPSRRTRLVALPDLPFRWSRVYFFGSYTSATEINRRLGTQWEGAEQAAPLTDWQQSVVFMNGREVVAWADVSPDVLLFYCVDRRSGYPPTQRFVAYHRAGDGYWLHPRGSRQARACDA